ncbi:subunit DAD1 of dolichyl-diphosphooligosaccharide--protein glycosyltransferase [Chloropicon primus]|uniref:Dolichyl-diphosphooligosaccharide--protein glycosyltransferase subunit DAD1 n=1 Tax=Chloropicon primus TaxID=1764295 RepID=A0A5B8MBC3_9CHLO|nr:subunit DAD1 of dolichyl-diphosphooligosaccharide--protein glycosyltransferase [Chloropicon primus]UPQ96893.1 subunit DAD1 of dolichyl-diphosphooligosaccharide--protein glycosyltransferase [Chloropicon primus]|mmetsp:Transcript_8809/g.25145  ORF Transcript_8809/g.25145 Transcript_8809/m.25145 type:complete len:114 (+) Transcript_8809:197-538(+)|eukprot:QDZ17677.1 subunit DAD1 of dolichyl-diphosphooligosaccharide--protein glycosyltransferase [Chloropicon primus]
MLGDLKEIVQVFSREYSKTPKLLKIVDCFILYALTVAALQFAYMNLFGSFPYNAFLGGFFCTLGFAVLTVCFRMQIDVTQTEGADKLGNLEKVFADYCVACVFLFFVSISYVG